MESTSHVHCAVSTHTALSSPADKQENSNQWHSHGLVVSPWASLCALPTCLNWAGQAVGHGGTLYGHRTHSDDDFSKSKLKISMITVTPCSAVPNHHPMMSAKRGHLSQFSTFSTFL